MTDAYGWRVPGVYSSVAAEYRSATEGAGLVDRSYMGRLELTGADALDLLDRLSTNRLTDLTDAGQGFYTVLTSNKGRILDLLLVTRLEDRLLVVTGPDTRQKVAEWIDFYTFVEDVSVNDVTETTAMLGVVGPGAVPTLDGLTGGVASSLELGGSAPVRIDDVEARLVRTDFARSRDYGLVVPAQESECLWTSLLEAGADHGIRPVGMEAQEVARIEGGVPGWSRELTEAYNPLEADLLAFISFNKGCYIGQEVVARLDTYDKVQKRLVGLTWEAEESGATPANDATLTLDGKDVGKVTSVAERPDSGQGIGLGIVRKKHARPGVLLTVESPEGPITTRVEDLPLASEVKHPDR